MEHAVVYVWAHIVAFVALATTVLHIALRCKARKRFVMAALSSLDKIVPLIIAALGQAAAFESGKPITLQVPAESVTLDLSAEGFGKVTVGESGGVLTVCKVV